MRLACWAVAISSVLAYAWTTNCVEAWVFGRWEK